MNTNALTKVGVAFAAILLMVSAAATPAMAASNGLNYQDGDAPNPQFTVDQVTVDEWDAGEFDSPLEYYDDSGDATRLDGKVNRSSDVDDLGSGAVNPISLTATDIDIAEFGGFPRNDDESENSASALDASEWTASGATVEDATTAPGVDAVQYTGSASGDSATYSNITALDSDVEKRDLQLAADISSASGTPTLQLNDTDGDYVIVELYNASAMQSADNVVANSTGEGHVLQTEIGQLAVKGSGDGTMGEVVDGPPVLNLGDVLDDERIDVQLLEPVEDVPRAHAFLLADGLAATGAAEVRALGAADEEVDICLAVVGQRLDDLRRM